MQYFVENVTNNLVFFVENKVPKYVRMWLAEDHTPPYFECVLLWRLSTVKSFASKNKYNIWSSSSVACKNAELGCADKHEGWALSITNLELWWYLAEIFIPVQSHSKTKQNIKQMMGHMIHKFADAYELANRPILIGLEYCKPGKMWMLPDHHGFVKIRKGIRRKS